MSQAPMYGPVVLSSYLSPQGVTTLSGPIMQPGHNMHPVSIEPLSPHSLQYGHPHPAMNIGPPSPQTYSRTPSPTVPPSAPPAPQTMAFQSWPAEAYQNAQMHSLLAKWPMNGPTYPSSLITYLANQGPMPDINALQAQLLQANTDIARGKYVLCNPSIADPRTIKSSWSDGIDYSQTPMVVADPKVHGLPLPPPEPLPVIPSNPMISVGSGLNAYNGRWM